MKISVYLILLLFIQSCSIYKSPDRKEFESESPNFKVQNLQKKSCSNKSLQSTASQSRLITTWDNASLWEHIINNQSKFESANFKNGEFCIYE